MQPIVYNRPTVIFCADFVLWMPILEKQKDSLLTDFSTIQLPPLPFWKWSLAILLLLVVPLGILFQQADEAFSATVEMARSDIGQQLESLSSRIALEMEVNVQLREIINDFNIPYIAVSERLYYLQHFRRLCRIPLPVEAAVAMKGLENAHGNALVYLEKRLKRLIPGVKLLKWDSEYHLRSDSDELLPRWAYQRIVKALEERLTRGDNEHDRSYLNNIPALARVFLDKNRLTMFLRNAAAVYEFSDASGRNLAMYWENNKVSGYKNDFESGGGFLVVVDLELLPRTFAFDMIKLRKGHEWKSAGVNPGWLIKPGKGGSFLPYPFSPTEEAYWQKWLYSRPNGVHEHRSLLVSIRRVSGGMMLVVAKSTQALELAYRRNIFLLSLFVIMALLLPIIIVSSCRKNSGMALSIRWQIIALFVLTMALPNAVLFHLGSELVKDRRRIYENNAFKDLEGIKKNLEENNDYAFHYLENLSNEMGNRMMKLRFDNKRRLLEPGKARKIIDEYRNRTNLTAVYLLDAGAETIFHRALDRSTGKDLIPLVQSLAKIKLRYTGNLKMRRKTSEIGMVDLFIEASGGMSVDTVQNILKYRDNKAFEFRFSNRRVCFFVGEFTQPGGDESFILVVVLKDGDFERMFMRLMIDNHIAEKKYRNRVQLYFGANNTSGENYFRQSSIEDPWFNYLVLDEDTVKIGRLSESTRFSGVAIKERIYLKNGRKCLFYSFRPANLDRHSVVALRDYTDIDYSLAQLRIFIIVTFLVSLLIGYVLARVMARSLIDPVSILQRGVEQVQLGNYRTRLVMPGEDELVELAESFNRMNRGLDERERMTRYLSRSAVKAVEDGEDALMGGRKVPATILFSDIRSFTTISESNTAETVVALLNDYFAVMNRVVEKHGGDIDKFIGDAIMAQFMCLENTGETPADQALKAIRCALAMMRALADFNVGRAEKDLFPVKIGVGINSGEVIAGNIGSPGRMDRTVIGDTVNVASRLEGMSKLGRHTHVIISRATLNLVRDVVEVEQLAETSVKGKTSAVEMFEVIAIKDYN